MKILVIDDKASQLAALAEILQGFIPDCETVTADSGQAGLELARTCQPDTIILDVQMPGMDGFQVCQALKADPATRHIPVIFLTGEAADSASRIRGLEIGGDAFLTHPIEMGELISQVRAMVRIKRAEDVLRAEKLSVDCMLRETREHEAAILHTARDAFFVIDLQGRFLDVNEAAGQLTGYSRAELLRMSVADLEADEAPAEIAVQLEKIRQAGDALFERRFRRKDGRIVHVELSVNYLRNSEERLFAFIRDITERKRAEESLRESEERFGQLFENSPVATWLEDFTAVAGWMQQLRAQGVTDLRAFLGEHPDQIQQALGLIRVLDLNRAAATQNGARSKQELQASLPQLIRDATCTAFIGELEALWQGQTSFEFESHSVRLDGRPLDLIVHVDVPRKSGVPDYSRVIVTGTDITERKRVEEALRQSEERYRHLFDRASVGIILLSLDGKIFSTNEVYARAHGYSPQEMLGVSPIDLDTPASAKQFPERLRRILAGETLTFEAENYHKDGRVIPFEVSAGIISVGGKSFVQAFVRDISERKRAEAAVAALALRHETLLQAACDGIHVLDLQGNVVEANAAFVTMLGYTRAELLQLNVADFDAQLSRAELLARIGALTPQPVMFETRHRRKDGTICEVEIYAVSLMLEGRKHCYASTRDITARKQTEQRLRLQGGALEAAANAIVITDREGNIEWVNAAFTTVTGYSVAEVVGKNPRLLKSGKHDPAFYQNLWDTICAGNAWRGEIINRRQDGSFYTEDIMITPLKDERGEITHFIAVKQDITQRKLLEEEFRQSQKMEAFGQLAGGVAHDFNNILTVIQGGAALLQMNLTAEDKDQAIQQIAQAAKRAAGLTSQLLSFSRRQIMHARPVDLNESVTAMGKMLQRLIGENITLQTRLLPGGAPVHADPGMIEQILLNLAVNARDAMPAGGQLGITLENLTLTPAAAALHHLARPGNFIRLTVQDTGAGIPPEILPRIFEPFFTTKDIGKGTGLGLATVHGIIQQHHGWVQVESEPGKGSTFHVFLPRLAGMHEIQSEEQAVQRVRGGSETILLVEDDDALRELARRALEHYGYRVIEAASGLAALETWRQHGRQVDLLLTDIIMPEGVSGSELVVQLQAAKPGLKIIYMSGYPGEVAGRGLELDEGTNFLQKPFTPAKLAQIVRDCLDAALKL